MTHLVRDVIAGAVAGAVGTLAMDLVWWARHRASGGEQSFPEWDVATTESFEEAAAPAQEPELFRRAFVPGGGRTTPGLSSTAPSPSSEAPVRHRLPVLLLALALGASACSTAATDDAPAIEAEVLPFSEIQDGEVSFEADPLDPNTGIFRVDTTEPAICAIVWGETDEFGRFNNSLAMEGTGIIEHDVKLPDLEPGREYVYVLQGTTADGTLYRSEVDTFVIPEGDAAEAASPAPDLGPNLALDASVAEVSSEFNDSFSAVNAIDGDLSTEWSSSDDGDDAFLTIDLGAPTDVTGVAFLTRSMADGTAITETFTVTLEDGEVLGPFPAGSPANPRVAEVDTTGQQLTFEVASSTGGNVGAVEVQVFGG